MSSDSRQRLYSDGERDVRYDPKDAFRSVPPTDGDYSATTDTESNRGVPTSGLNYVYQTKQTPPSTMYTHDGYSIPKPESTFQTKQTPTSSVYSHDGYKIDVKPEPTFQMKSQSYPAVNPSGEYKVDAKAFVPQSLRKPPPKPEIAEKRKGVPTMSTMGSDWGFTDTMLIFGNLSAGTTKEMLLQNLWYYTEDRIIPKMYVFESDETGSGRRMIIAEFQRKEDAIFAGSKLNGCSIQGNILVCFIVADFIDLVKRSRRTILVASMEERLDNEYIHRFFRKNGTLDFWSVAQRRSRPPYTACVCFHNTKDYEAICDKSRAWTVPDGKYFVLPAPSYELWSLRVRKEEEVLSRAGITPFDTRQQEPAAPTEQRPKLTPPQYSYFGTQKSSSYPPFAPRNETEYMYVGPEMQGGNVGVSLDHDLSMPKKETKLANEIDPERELVRHFREGLDHDFFTCRKKGRFYELEINV